MKTIPKIDDRLTLVAALFSACDVGADIGADHGRLSCHLLAENKVGHMMVTDISAPSLQKAKELLRMHHLENRATFLHTDGLQGLEKPVDCLAICGMGGGTIIDILTQGKEKLGEATLVLSAQRDVECLRKTLMGMHYLINQEVIAKVNDKHYVILRAVKGEAHYDERTQYLGPVLLKDTSSTYLSYLYARFSYIEKARSQIKEKHKQWLKEEMERVENNCT